MQLDTFERNYAHIWTQLCTLLNIFEHICAVLSTFEHIWAHLSKFERIWTYLQQIWAHLDAFERNYAHIWTYLSTFENIWTYLSTFEQFWVHLSTFDHIWAHLRKFQQIWTNLNISVANLNTFQVTRSWQHHILNLKSYKGSWICRLYPDISNGIEMLKKLYMEMEKSLVASCGKIEELLMVVLKGRLQK